MEKITLFHFRFPFCPYKGQSNTPKNLSDFGLLYFNNALIADS